jgi:transcriptional regulator GlxA family with amidase domain
MALPRPIKVLYHLHPKLDTMDFTGPFEILSTPVHVSTLSSPSGPTKIFQNTIAAVSEDTITNQNLTLKRHIPTSEAHDNLADYDILVIPGGGSPGVLQGKTEPLDLIKAFASLPKKGDGSIRTILSVCTGSLLLAEAGVLDGKSATTHPVYYGKLEEVSAAKGKTNVLKERFVTNKVDEEKGLRIVTAGGVSCGLDASLWLTGELVGKDCLDFVADRVQYAYREGAVL